MLSCYLKKFRLCFGTTRPPQSLPFAIQVLLCVSKLFFVPFERLARNFGGESSANAVVLLFIEFLSVDVHGLQTERCLRSGQMILIEKIAELPEHFHR